jgi:putative heat shock protein hspR
VKLGLAERVFAAGTSGDVVHIARGTRPAPRQRSSAVVLYRQHRQPATADDTKPQR